MQFALIEVTNMPAAHVVKVGDYQSVVAAIPGEIIDIEADADNPDCWDAFTSTGQIFVVEHLGTPLARRLLG
jgi:hypothetical protein